MYEGWSLVLWGGVGEYLHTPKGDKIEMAAFSPQMVYAVEAVILTTLT